MGIPWKTVLNTGLAVVGTKVGDDKLLEVEKTEITLLKKLVEQQAVTNAILMKMLEDNDHKAAEEVIEELARHDGQAQE